MIAVCGIGNPSGLRNSATTAYQSARPPMVAASAKAATKPKTGCSGSNIFAVTNSASVRVRTSVASTLTRRSSAARAASPGASNEKVPDVVMPAFGAYSELVESLDRYCTCGRHPEVLASSASLEGWQHGARSSSFEARKSAHLRMTDPAKKEGPHQA